mgnify:CR=1 FL=1
MSSKPSTTIGFERRFNHALAESYQDFMTSAAGPQPPRPANMEAIVELNRGSFFGATGLPSHVDGSDASVLDVREAPAFATCHHPGAVNVPVSVPTFGTKQASVLPDGPLAYHSRAAAPARLDGCPCAARS